MIQYQKFILRFVFVLGLFVFAFWLAKTSQESAWILILVAEYHYFGVFILSFLSGFNTFVPVSVISFVPLFLEVGLSFWITVFVIILGITIADVLGFFLGFMGRDIARNVENVTLVKRLDALRERHYWGPVVVLFFYASLVPLPNELIVIPLGFMKYRLIHILPALLLGNIVFHVAVAYGVVKLFGIL